MLTLDPTPTKTPRLRSAAPPVPGRLPALRRCVWLGLRRCARGAAGGAAWLRGAWLRWLAAPKLRRGLRSGPARLCLGSGNAPIPGWINVDLDGASDAPSRRSEEHTSELQSLRHLVCRLLLEKKKEK